MKGGYEGGGDVLSYQGKDNFSKKAKAVLTRGFGVIQNANCVTDKKLSFK